MTTGGKMFFRVLILLLALMLTAVGCGGKPAADKPSSAASDKKAGSEDLDFYNGKTVTFIVATKAGGGYDTYARLIAPFLQKYLPGSTVLVKNVPGAGHIIGANEIYNAKPDGLTLGIFEKGLILSQIRGDQGIKFDLKKFSWLGNAASGSRVLLVGAKKPYTSWEDLKKAKEIKWGGAGLGASDSNDALLIDYILGINGKVIQGYKGEEANLAIMKGEIDGAAGSYDSYQRLIEDKEARAILLIGTPVSGLKDVPMLVDIAPADKKPIAHLLDSQAKLGRILAAPPGIPEGRVRVMREAMKKSLEDPELLARAKQMKLPIDYMPGEELARSVSSALDQSPEVVEIIKKITGPSEG